MLNPKSILMVLAVACGLGFTAEQANAQTRGASERRAVEALGERIAYAAGFTKNPVVVSQRVSERGDRTFIDMEVTYTGSNSGKRYTATIKVTLDGHNQEVTIDYRTYDPFGSTNYTAIRQVARDLERSVFP